MENGDVEAASRPAETPENLQRYLTLKEFGKSFFKEKHVVKTGEVDETDVAAAR